MSTLKGMTWNHSRGFDPMVATAREFARTHPDVEITWEKRSLQAFADFSVEKLAREFDLIVIDHPHVGEIAASRCLVPLEQVGRDAELRTLAAESTGVSHRSYEYNGHQWALAIDAATQVASYRPDLLTNPPRTWDEGIDLAKAGKVLWPIKPVDALMSFFTLAANRGTPWAGGSDTLVRHPLRYSTADESSRSPSTAIDVGQECPTYHIRREDALAVLESLQGLAQHVPRECLSMNPIETYERMSTTDEFIYCPLGYGYTNYARDGYRAHLLKFTDIPALGDAGPRGSTIGGTGLGISASCRTIDIAVDYAFFVASAACQRGLYFDAGGQPANSAAWDDDRCNQIANNFFRDTRRTIDLAYLRPRYAGYMDFQDRAGGAINAFLAGEADAIQTAQTLEQLYEQSRR